MKLLKIKANHFKNCGNAFYIDFVASSKKTSEDKEYELQEIAEDLFVFNSMAFVGKNASGKTTALELLDACYSILGEFRLEGKHWDYNGVELEIYFYHNGNIYLYQTRLKDDSLMNNKASFCDEHIFAKPYYKTNVKTIYDQNGFKELTDFGVLPEDTSRLFFILEKKTTRALYFDSFGNGADTYQMVFKALNTYNISIEILSSIMKIFDENIQGLKRLDDHNYVLTMKNEGKTLSDSQLVYLLSSGTTKGLLLYTMVVASLQNGFDLLIDEIENHFHKTLVENILSLYKDKSVNKKNASLILTTHYCELLDQFGRQDNIWICKADDEIRLSNMYADYDVRTELLKSKQFYKNVFKTAVNYNSLMDLKKRLMK